MTSSTVDLRTLPINTPSLCIPRVFSNIDEKRIRRIFDELNMGIIERIDIVGKNTEKGEKFNRVFVHYKRWFSNSNADMARDRLLNGKEIKIIYDDPWFWKVSAYREVYKPEKNKPEKNKPEKKKVTIQFDDSEDESQNQTPSRPLTNRTFTDEFGRDKKPYQRQRQDPRQRQDIPELKRSAAETYKPRSPSNSPPRQHVEEPIKELHCSQEAIPVIHHRITKRPSASKVPLTIEKDDNQQEQNKIQDNN